MCSGKSFRLRFVHALGYELIALLVCAPVMAWVFDVSATHAGLLTLTISLLAMAWNMAFNTLFDRLMQQLRWLRGVAMRAAHAVLFELGLLLLAVPLAAWWLEVSVIDALLLDLGFLLFFLPYTLVYNWAFDLLLDRSASAVAASSR